MFNWIANHPWLFLLIWFGVSFVVAVFFGKFAAVGRGDR